MAASCEAFCITAPEERYGKNDYKEKISGIHCVF
jgi:hypothetical protein